MTAIVIQHNFIENHSTTDEVPSERAGFNLELGENRWLNLIRLGSQHMEFPTDNMSKNLCL
ncbi:MAG: hypothetical protein AABX90_04155 [Nanoarchaeota archaeon]